MSPLMPWRMRTPSPGSYDCLVPLVRLAATRRTRVPVRPPPVPVVAPPWPPVEEVVPPPPELLAALALPVVLVPLAVLVVVVAPVPVTPPPLLHASQTTGSAISQRATRTRGEESMSPCTPPGGWAGLS